MRIGNWVASGDLNETFAEISRHGLLERLAELESYGFTVVEDLLTPNELSTAREAVLHLAEAQTGIRPDLLTGTGHDNWRLIPYLMTRHSVFQDILLNERMLALVTYLVGRQCQLSSMSSHFKGMGRGGEISLHTDTWMPPPLPRYAHVCTVNFALVDYTREGGALAVVPASHRRARNPAVGESFLSGTRENKEAIAVEVRAGSMMIWHGNTWHGSYPRSIPGLRLNLSLHFVRPWMRVHENYAGHLPASVVERHGHNARFRQLAGLDDATSWREEGPRYLDPRENVSVFQEDEPTHSNQAIRVGATSWHS